VTGARSRLVLGREHRWSRDGAVVKRRQSAPDLLERSPGEPVAHGTVEGGSREPFVGHRAVSLRRPQGCRQLHGTVRLRRPRRSHRSSEPVSLVQLEDRARLPIDVDAPDVAALRLVTEPSNRSSPQPSVSGKRLPEQRSECSGVLEMPQGTEVVIVRVERDGDECFGQDYYPGPTSGQLPCVLGELGALVTVPPLERLGIGIYLGLP